jgi:hypothetical protein
MPSIILNRTSELINGFRNYNVYIDGEKVGTIGNGDRKEFSVSPGPHTLVTTIDWCSSPTIKFDITEQEVKIFKTSGFKNSVWLIPTALVLLLVNYIVSSRYGFKFIYLVTPIFLLIIYYITFGRKRYLTLFEVENYKN